MNVLGQDLIVGDEEDIQLPVMKDSRILMGKIQDIHNSKHNALQIAIVEKFGPRYARDAVVLYLGDAASKFVIYEQKHLEQLGVPITTHDKLPDVILYQENKNWLYLIEAVTSHGPVSHKRKYELEKLLQRCTAQPIYVTAFPDAREFRRHAAEIAWETEVWIAETPEHMIHYNGDKFAGPHEK